MILSYSGKCEFMIEKYLERERANEISQQEIEEDIRYLIKQSSYYSLCLV